MNEPRSEILFFFDGKFAAMELYLLLEERLRESFPAVVIRVQKSQITFSNRRVFGCASLLRLRGQSGEYLVVTFGLDRALSSPRIAVATEPYPNRWTHHVPVREPRELDDELFGWLSQAYDFSAAKR